MISRWLRSHLGKYPRTAFFTPGPPPVISSALREVNAAFGRGDINYAEKRTGVINWLKVLTGKETVVELQGSGSLAIEIMIRNFVFGKVLIVHSGYYSERILEMCRNLLNRHDSPIKEIKVVPHNEIDDISEGFDWVLAAYVETSIALKQDLPALRALADRSSAQLGLDSVASIGLEDHHELADALAFSSCKGLFGITGAGFIAFDSPPTNIVEDFYLNISSHQNRLMTGPYAQIQYLFGVSKVHSQLKKSVEKNKKTCIAKFQNYLFNNLSHEPLLCTRLTKPVKSFSAKAVLYNPRSSEAAAVINHLGELHLGNRARGKILELIEIINE